MSIGTPLKVTQDLRHLAQCPGLSILDFPPRWSRYTYVPPDLSAGFDRAKSIRSDRLTWTVFTNIYPLQSAQEAHQSVDLYAGHRSGYWA